MKTSIVILATFVFLLSVQAKIINKEISSKSNDPQEITWEKVAHAWTRCFAINTQGDIFAGAWSNVFRSGDNGTTWEYLEINNNIYAVISIAINSNDDIFLTTEGGTFYRSTADGNNWVQLHADSGDFFTDIDINSTDEIFIGTIIGVVRSVNDGDDLEETGWNHSVDHLIIKPSDDIFIRSWGGCYRSTDNGNNWTNAFTGLTNTGINAFAFNSLGHIFAGTAAPEGGVFISTNNGDNWTVTGYSFLNELDSVATALGISSADEIFVGTLGLGVLHSTDNGNSWIEINSGLPLPIGGWLLIYSFIVNVEGYILVGTASGIFRSLEPVVSIEDIAYKLPISFSIEQNYPNPFNPSTKIRYSVPQLSKVVIKVFDILGNEIETLVNEEKSAGSYEITWITTNLPSGIYFYTLQAQDFIETKKMILLK